ncbi:MAG: hypothetical protein U5L45_26110 [Saprospiraceae bacterium]|nr:hypothetical protein [Saprospiraceae bacterium]
MVHFSALPKNEPHSLFLRERSKRVVNSYDLFTRLKRNHLSLVLDRVALKRDNLAVQ